MTQAIACSQILRSQGHEITRVLMGSSKRRRMPDFFRDEIGAPVTNFESPNFILDKNNRAIRIWPTILHNLIHGRKFIGSVRNIRKLLEREKPDIVFNFYDILCGLAHFGYKKKYKLFGVGHQFLAGHRQFDFSPGHLRDRFFFRFNNFITGYGSDAFIALSFRPYQPEVQGKIRVTPPLIRKEALQKQPVEDNFILAYMVNDGYAEELINWHRQNPGETIHCFWDRKDASDTYMPHENLTFHRLNGPLFIDMMSRCKGLVSTSGFESVCEAMIMGKPVMMIPVANQYEQACNAIDARVSGAGIEGSDFDLTNFLTYIKTYNSTRERMLQWVNSMDKVMEDLMEE